MDYFKSLPWFDALTKEPGFETFTPVSRSNEDYDDDKVPKNQLLRRTLNNRDAIPHCVGFYMKHTPPHVEGHKISASNSVVTEKSPKKRFLVPSCSVAYDLRPGVNGLNGTVQGGFAAALMDDTMIDVIILNDEAQQRYGIEGELPADVVDLRRQHAATAYINVQFRKPIFTPQVVVVTASPVSLKGRKLILSAEIKDEKGDICVTCESLLIGLLKEKI
ncbi:hypothetical protein D7B24_002964 [Verticillium nonalfalfae]|uniref:Predicted protein n=2 Tax=Verticillium TaxID=1036719 RepID=C9SJM1_VERA1|nr:predicted protein [Verticillium alfalfae VaMs.102]XP_028497367.1 uncharacterized protein D7B24_002964 [Verticillium nonalfalfae]EEY19635.1 predicted protein [Verticillium alfalfae VaMs.102]RNJ59209.1 hypothetical protein D7B24_002964 [Verticillium nonalfalfae]